jgi:hypothetical protein
MIIDNSGEKLKSHSYKRISASTIKCTKCGFEAVCWRQEELKPTVFENLYLDILSCDEVVIKDIIE